ncbi:MAG: CidA/LrgA family protein [Burkholderiales bacterium]|nr:CidA/LrgA family protein [Burkholderiales bacterium]
MLLVCQLAGEIISQYFTIPIPGPVVGLVLLLMLFHLVPAGRATLAETSNGILRNLSLLFVPAGVGVMLHAATVVQEWLAIAVSLILGTAITLIVTALTIKFSACLLRSHRKER